MKLLKRIAAIAIVATGTFFAVGQVAAASAEPPPPVEVDTTNVSTVVVAAPIVTLVVSAAIPLITALMTKSTWPSWIKMTIMVVLNAINALFVSSQLADGTAAFSSEAFWTWLVGTVVSAVAYVIGYKPNGWTSNEGGKLANVGVH